MIKKAARGVAQAASWLCHGRAWMKSAADTSYARSGRSAKGDRMNPYLDPQAEFFDRASVPPQMRELLDKSPRSILARRG